MPKPHERFNPDILDQDRDHRNRQRSIKIYQELKNQKLRVAITQALGRRFSHQACTDLADLVLYAESNYGPSPATQFIKELVPDFYD